MFYSTINEFTPITEYIYHRVEENPKGKVVFHSDNIIIEETYDTVYKKSLLLAYYLNKIGVNSTNETMVGVCLKRGIELMIAILGIWKAGGTYVPLEYNNPDAVNYKLKNTHLTFIIGNQATREILSQPEIFYIDIKSNEYLRVQNSLIPPITPDTRAYIIYTSGTSGSPKGVEITHGALSQFWRNLINEQQESSQLSFSDPTDDKILINSPITFDAFIMEYLFGFLSSEMHLIEEENRISPGIMSNIIEKHCITILILSSSLIPQLNLEQLDSVRDLTSMGSSPKIDILLQLAKRKRRIVRNEWGATELTVANTANPCMYDPQNPQQFINQLLTIGKPTGGSVFYIFDPETLEPCTEGVLYVGGTQLARGYLNNPGLTQQRFVTLRPDPLKPMVRLYNTGDIVRQDESGNYIAIGRNDREVKWQGIRINLEGLESFLLQQDQIKNCAVIMKESNKKTFLIAYIETKTGEKIDCNILKKYLESQGIQYIPQFFFCNIPLTQNGKNDYNNLPSVTLETPAQLNLLENQIEHEIAQCWQEIMPFEQLDQIDPNKSFIDYGADSIAIMILQNLINERFHLKYPAIFTGKIFMQFQTIHAQAHEIERLQIISEEIRSDPYSSSPSNYCSFFPAPKRDERHEESDCDSENTSFFPDI